MRMIIILSILNSRRQRRTRKRKKNHSHVCLYFGREEREREEEKKVREKNFHRSPLHDELILLLVKKEKDIFFCSFIFNFSTHRRQSSSNSLVILTWSNNIFIFIPYSFLRLLFPLLKNLTLLIRDEGGEEEEKKVNNKYYHELHACFCSLSIFADTDDLPYIGVYRSSRNVKLCLIVTTKRRRR